MWMQSISTNREEAVQHTPDKRSHTSKISAEIHEMFNIRFHQKFLKEEKVSILVFYYPN